MSDNPPSPTHADVAADPDASAPLRLGFARGIAPTTWARRWEQVTGSPLELVPVNVAYGRSARAACDVTLERALPGARPADTDEADRTRHAIQLYTETLVLVVPREHELAERDTIDLTEVPMIALLDHPQHPPEWPAAEPWADPSWMPKSVPAALELVATGAGALLLPTLLARHLVNKRQHATLAVTGIEELPATSVWASWDVDRDAPDVQQLIGVLRGRTARSSRGEATADRTADGTAANTGGPAASGRQAKAGAQGTKEPQRAQGAKKAKSTKAGPKPGSRGAQLAATRKKPPHRGRR